ncbi:MAG: peptidoglycan DD-metalloendopeptidase family protein [Clostridia bacterium]|nr:peptidoglycan DD-metalloendopeptidase family protein [Clostridia bacterium]
MHKKILKSVSVLMAVVLFLTAFFVIDTGAASKSELQNEISKLEAESEKLEAEIKKYQGKINQQQSLKNAIERKMANVQSQIDVCNRQINSINEKIAANKAEIKENNKQIEADKLAFKKRLRAIYMSSPGSNIQILLGAEDFADFLVLSQLTASVSARDKKMIKELVKEIKKLEEKQEENKALLEDQVDIKKTIAAKKSELAKEESAIQAVINDIRKDQNEVKDENAEVEKELKQMQNELNAILNASGNWTGNLVYDGGSFLWPTPTVSRISSYYGKRWGRMHNGIDIANGNCWGDKIIAIADGVVTTYSNSCTHNYGKKPVRNCCGSGYGNYVTINHGSRAGKTYVAYYAHMAKITVKLGQKVKKGQIIGYIGSTGRSTGAHLHFGLAVNGAWVNPMSYYKKVG